MANTASILRGIEKVAIELSRCRRDEGWDEVRGEEGLRVKVIRFPSLSKHVSRMRYLVQCST